MPKYEYACKSCGERIEVVQSFSDTALTECPSCAGPLRKVFGAPGISFKGSGFYRTDNRKRRSEPKEAKSDAPADAKAGSASKPESGSGESSGGSSKPGESSGGSSKDAPAKKESAPAGDSKPKATEAKTA